MPRTVVLKTPSGEEVEYLVPDDMPEWQVKARHIWENVGDYTKDLGKSTAAGAGIGASNLVRDLVNIPLTPLKKGLEFAGKVTGKDLDSDLKRGDVRLKEELLKAEEAVGADYKPGSTAGAFAHSAARGAVGAMSKSPWWLATGAITGLATEGAERAGLGPTGTALTAFLTPALSALAHNFRPSVEGRYLAKRELESALGKPRKDPRVAGELAAAKQTAANAQGRGVPLLPGQSFSPGSPMEGLQERIALLSPELQRALTEQASTARGQAQSLAQRYAPHASGQDAADALKEAMTKALERREGLRESATRPLYSAAGGTPLTQRQAFGAANEVEALKDSMNLASGSQPGRFVDKLGSMIRNDSEGVVMLPGTPSTQRRTLINGQPGVAGSPGTPPRAQKVDLPIDTFGKLLSVRQDARQGLREIVDPKDAARAAAADRMNRTLHTHPQIAEADAKYADLTERLVTPFETKGPSGLVLATKDQPSTSILDSALDTQRFGKKEVDRMLRRSEAAVPGTSRMILGAKLRDALGDASGGADLGKVVSETPARFAGAVGQPGTPQRDAFSLLLKRSGEPDVPNTEGLVSALSRTGLGRSTVGGALPAPGSGGAMTAAPLLARALGTSPMLASVNPLAQTSRRHAVGQLGEALSDPSFKELERLLLTSALKDRMMQGLRTYTIGAGQDPFEAAP